jgi:hypothetical protein
MFLLAMYVARIEFPRTATSKDTPHITIRARALGARSNEPGVPLVIDGLRDTIRFDMDRTEYTIDNDLQCHNYQHRMEIYTFLTSYISTTEYEI